METITLFTQKNRKGIIHLVVLAIAYTFFMRTTYGFEAMRSLGIYNTLTYIFAFYIQTFLLLPILLEKKNLKKYLFLSLGCLVVMSLIQSWLRAMHSSLITYHEDGTRPVPMEFFLSKDWMITGIIGFFPIFITIGLLSFIYYLLINNIKSFSPYLEISVNLIVLLVFSVIAFQTFTPPLIVITYLGLTVFYVNTFFITPFLITEKKRIKYTLSLIMLCIGYFVLFFTIIIKLGGILGIATIFFLIPTLLVTLFLSFVYGSVRLKIKAKQKATDLKLEAKESELSLLKSQVNPHFLFNSLNTLYATALTENAPKSSESIAKLASLIRYMQEDINKDFIPLQKEIKYLQDYIAIQKLRCAVEPQVETHFENFENHSISPGLLIPFVENAFKYGIDPSKASKLEVAVYCDENRITFECVNSYDEDYKTYYKEQGFGIGIENAKQRLELVYPKKHSFEIVKENNIFSVKIAINTSEK